MRKGNGMKKSSLIVATFGGVLAAGFLTVSAPVAHSVPNSYKIVVDGNDFTQQWPRDACQSLWERPVALTE
jgi:hypothetical protein